MSEKKERVLVFARSGEYRWQLIRCLNSAGYCARDGIQLVDMLSCDGVRYAANGWFSYIRLKVNMRRFCEILTDYDVVLVPDANRDILKLVNQARDDLRVAGKKPPALRQFPWLVSALDAAGKSCR